jgi:hypothetical protein
MANTILHKKAAPFTSVFKDEPAVFCASSGSITPLVDADVSSKNVDDQINFAVVASAAGLDVKQSVRTATTANVGTYTATGGFYKRSDNWGT